MQEDYFMSPLGDAALVIGFTNRIDETVHARVLSLFYRLKEAAPFIKDVVPAYGSLTIHYDVLQLHSKKKTAWERMKEFVEPILQETKASEPQPGRNIHIPVCYAEAYAPDLQELAQEKQLSPESVIQLHLAVSYKVYMIGFLPGFPYMGTVDSRIAAPRKSSPRQNIPAGSVGIAGSQTGIYPLSSPGGWNIIGRTPLMLFDAGSTQPVLLQPGDTVTFYSITEDEFANY